MVPSVKKGRKNSSKYVYYDEIGSFFESGKSVLIYQHFSRKKRADFIRRISAELEQRLPGGTVRAFRTPHVAFFMVVHRKQQQLAHVPLDRLLDLKIVEAVPERG